jgi:hypothetical protein
LGDPTLYGEDSSLKKTTPLLPELAIFNRFQTILLLTFSNHHHRLQKLTCILIWLDLSSKVFRFASGHGFVGGGWWANRRRWTNLIYADSRPQDRIRRGAFLVYRASVGRDGPAGSRVRQGFPVSGRPPHVPLSFFSWKIGCEKRFRLMA